MFIWIFKPSDKWKYCGGGVVVLAKDFSRAVQLCKEHENEEYYEGMNKVKDESSEYIDEDSYEKVKAATLTYLKRENQDLTSIESLIGVNVFVLVEHFEVDSKNERVVLHSFNYA